MKKLILLFGIIFRCFNVYSESIGYEPEDFIKVMGTIIDSGSIKKISDVDFGVVPAGTSAKQKVKGQIKITGTAETDEKIKLYWGETENDLKVIDCNENGELWGELAVKLYNNKNSTQFFSATIVPEATFLIKDGDITMKGVKEVNFKGNIEKVPMDALVGNYKGSFIVRVEFIGN